MTDPVGMVLFWVYVALMAVIVTDGFVHGNIKRLTHGVDWDGRICGNPNNNPAMAEVADKPYMMFCGSPERVNGFPKYIIEGSTACVTECPKAGTTLTIDCLMPAYHNFTSYKGGTITAVNGQPGLVNVETLDMTLTQSVTAQSAYATEPYGGRFCLPSKENPVLRDLIVNGPWGKQYRPLVTIGGLVDAWPLFAISAAVAIAFGALYVFCLGRCAGVLIFVTMVMTTLMILALGIFFFWAVIMDMDDLSTDYAKFNPIMSVYVGQEAQMYSVVTGVIVILVSVILGGIAVTSITHIDEMIGLINAAVECINAGFSLKVFPIMQALVFCAIFILFWFIGLPIVVSLGAEDFSSISVDGEGVNGLNRIWKRSWLQKKEIWFYIVGIFFMLEFYIQLGHYIVAYTVCAWFFTEGHDVAVDNNKTVQKAIGAGGGKKVEVRVAGVDPNYGPRQGSVVMTNAGKMLVVPIGKKGPGLGRLDMEENAFIKPDVACGSMTGGLFTGMFFHVGTIALGCPIIFVLRPFRMLSKCLSHFLHKTKEPEKHWNEHESHHRPPTADARNCLSLVASALEQIFGCFGKDAFTECVLAGQDGFIACSFTSFKFLIKSGGSVAHLHGSLIMYEIFGTLFITIWCGWMTLIIQDKVDWFNDPTSKHYIEDKDASAIAGTIIAFSIAFAFMSTWAQIADVMLYCVSWNRKQLAEGEMHKFERNEIIKPVNTYCPQQLRYLLPEHEREASHEGGLKSHEGMGHAMQILATMEHGALQSMTGAGASMHSRMM